MNRFISTRCKTFKQKVHYILLSASTCAETTQCFAMTPPRDITSPSIYMEDGLIYKRRVIRRHLAHTAADSCNQQKKEEGDSRGQLVSPDKAFCITSDWVGILRRCSVMIVIWARACLGVLSEDFGHFVFMCVFVRARERRTKGRTWECLCKSRTRGKCKHDMANQKFMRDKMWMQK